MTDEHQPGDATKALPDRGLPTAGRKPPPTASGPIGRPIRGTHPAEPVQGGGEQASTGRIGSDRPASGRSGAELPGEETTVIRPAPGPGRNDEETTRLPLPVTDDEPTVARDRPVGLLPDGPTQRLWSPQAPAESSERVNEVGTAPPAVVPEKAAGNPEPGQIGLESPGGEKSEAAQAGPGQAGPVPAKPAPWQRLSSAGALILVLLALFGFTLVVQLRSNDGDQGLATARQEDLVRILSDLEARDSRLQSEIGALETSQRQLTSGVAGRQAALAEADKRADELGLLAGTLPGRGPGLKIVMDKVKASAILNTVQELRGSGAEVMALAGSQGATVRIVASSYFVDAEGGGILVDGVRLNGPYTVWVIGPPQTMQPALQIQGGVVASVNSGGGSVTMEARTMVEVTAVRKATTLQYARPVS